MSRGIFITGTDTGIGKTRVATGLLSALLRRGTAAVGMKPVECGGREDAQMLRSASADAGGGLPDLDLVNPFHFPDPLAPAATGGGSLDFQRIGDAFEALASGGGFVVVEGAGGWLVPLDSRRTMEDLAVALALPVVIVAANRLGVLSHTLLTHRAIRSCGLHCAAVFLNSFTAEEDLSRQSNCHVLQQQLPGTAIIEDDVESLASLVPSK